jgi:hypothetical protein
VIAELDVTLTDWVLAGEAAVLAVLVHRCGGRDRAAWTVFFASVGVAALLGGIVHGIFPGGHGTTVTAVWRATLLAIGVTAAAGIVAVARALEHGTGGLALAAALAWLGYAVVVLFVTDVFAVAIAVYLPVALALLAAFVVRYRRSGALPALLGALGLVILLAGSWVQWRQITLHPVYFTYNAVYHVIEMVALVLIYRGARWLVATGR